jgi:hypothetical protein
MEYHPALFTLWKKHYRCLFFPVFVGVLTCRFTGSLANA